MKFGVVACPDCRTARIIDLSPKTFSCQRCGKRHESAAIKKFYTTDSDEEARRALGELNVRLSGKLEAYEEFREAQSRPVPMGVEARRGEAATVDSLVEGMRGGVVEFDEKGLAQRLEAEGIDGDRAASHIERLVAGGVIYEPTPGRFRFV
ncbi:MAG: hypothetical protein HY556_07950 [Euryarchaeota archaeon]|nr:hypothetical protein [Euryarchaeota archaeon]